MADPRDESPEAAATDDGFEFRILSTAGGLLPSGAGDMCVADELFSHGKLLPLHPAPDSPTLPRSDSAAAAAGLGSRSDSGRRSASSSGSSSSTGCVSRSHSSKSAASDAVLHGAAAAPRRSLASSLFYAHPSPSPQLRSRSARPRRSTGSSAPPPPAGAAWGGFNFIRLGVVGAPDVYPPRLADAKITAASRGGSGRSARFERAASAVEKSLRKHGAGLFGDGFGCRCSPDVVVEPAGLPEAAKKSGDDGGVKKKGRSVRRIRILDWLEELSITRQKK